MHAMESSDRRLKWENVAESVEATSAYLVVRDRAFGPGYFLEEAATSMQMEGARPNGVSLLACAFEGGRWIDVVFEYSELTHVSFRHVYFQAVDFRGANLRHVRFEHCIFSECAAPEGEAVEKIGCFFREVPRALPVPPPVVAPAVAGAPMKTDSGAPIAKPAPTPPDRFDGLER